MAAPFPYKRRVTARSRSGWVTFRSMGFLPALLASLSQRPPSWDPFLARQVLENALKDAEAAGVGSDVLECLATSVEACEPKGLRTMSKR